MLSVEDALGRVLSVHLPVRTETVPLSEALDRVLAEPVLATLPLPPWDNSAMDGYALRAADTERGQARQEQPDCEHDGPRPAPGVALRVSEVIGAGRASSQALSPGTCARIMTGAPLPPGADAVVMQENTQLEADGLVRILGIARPGQHVRRAGEDVQAGETVLTAGQRLSPGRLGLCAALGKDAVVVARRPRVAILATGDELVPPGQPLAPGQIWSSNTASLLGLVREAGGQPIDCGIAGDSREGTRAAIRAVLDSEPDLLVTTGGVSVGDFDMVKQAFADVGADMAFWKIAMKPGKPLAFGVVGGVPVFGLPGNPVASSVCFLQFVRPVLRRALGDPRPYLAVVDAVLADRVSKRPGRAELVRVRLELHGGRLEAHLAGGQGSGNAASMAAANGLLLLSANSGGAAPGDRVAVQIFDPDALHGADPQYRWGGRPASP